MKLIHLLLLLLLIFTGSSAQELDQVEGSKVSQAKEIDLAEDEFAEFSDEMKEEPVYDPLSGYNRVMTDFNDIVYTNLLTPVAKAYASVVDIEIRKSINNFFHNIYFPVRFANNILQGKFQNATEETQRFLVNTTFGFLGLFDPAKNELGLEAHNEDFGQTLGFYGVGSGVHIVLPIFGPSNLRDAIAMVPDSYLSPIDYEKRGDYPMLSNETDEFVVVKSVEYINKFSLSYQQYEKIKTDAVDLYPYLRDIYEQRREKQIKE